MPSRPFPFPADSIVASAAQSAIRIIEAQIKKGITNIPNMLAVVHIVATTLLMGLHAAAAGVGASGNKDIETRKREREKALDDVRKCTECLELAESRWIMARKFL